MINSGLDNVIAGETGISSVGKEGLGLTYRGYSVKDLALHSSFEEVAYLLIYGKLPNTSELSSYKDKLTRIGTLSPELKNLLETLPRNSHPMDVISCAISLMGVFESESQDGRKTATIGDQLISVLPYVLGYWYRYHTKGEKIDSSSIKNSTIAGRLSHVFSGHSPDQETITAIDSTLILYAEHEFNASTFVARAVTSTLSDTYSAVNAAVGALKGNLHGGANEAAIQFISGFDSPNQAEKSVMQLIKSKRLIMGFGHRVYKNGDPRSPVVKKLAAVLATKSKDPKLYDIAERIEHVMQNEKGIYPNLDFYSAVVYHFSGIPVEMFTPIFVIARTPGWIAHVIEQKKNNRLIRPIAHYNGPSERPFVKIHHR